MTECLRIILKYLENKIKHWDGPVAQLRDAFHPNTFLSCRAFWKRRRNEARLKRYMLLIFDRSVMTKYILLALSARGR